MPISGDGDRRAVVIADRDDNETGYVGERLREHGYRLHCVPRPVLLDQVGELVLAAELVLLLGSADAVHDTSRATAVEAEAATVRLALSAGVPVLGICYGAQLIVHALGGSVRPVERGEVGWMEVESLDDELCGTGPWLQFHSDVLTVPPEARPTGRTRCGPQGFVVEPNARHAGAVAWQFHPETTPATLERWVGAMPDYVRFHGADPVELVTEARRRETASREAAARLVDASLRYVRGAPARATPDSQRNRPHPL